MQFVFSLLDNVEDDVVYIENCYFVRFSFGNTQLRRRVESEKKLTPRTFSLHIYNERCESWVCVRPRLTSKTSSQRIQKIDKKHSVVVLNFVECGETHAEGNCGGSCFDFDRPKLFSGSLFVFYLPFLEWNLSTLFLANFTYTLRYLFFYIRYAIYYFARGSNVLRLKHAENDKGAIFVVCNRKIEKKNMSTFIVTPLTVFICCLAVARRKKWSNDWPNRKTKQKIMYYGEDKLKILWMLMRSATWNYHNFHMKLEIIRVSCLLSVSRSHTHVTNEFNRTDETCERSCARKLNAFLFLFPNHTTNSN